MRVPGTPRGVQLLEVGDEGPGAALVARAFERGRARGLAQGAAEAATGAARALAEAGERLDAFREEAGGRLAASAAELAVEIARRLLRVEVDAGRYDLERIVRETLAAASVERASCVVHLHPDDLEALHGVRFRTGTRVQADVGVARGDVHLETTLGLFVRELDGALDSIAERLREDLR